MERNIGGLAGTSLGSGCQGLMGRMGGGALSLSISSPLGTFEKLHSGTGDGGEATSANGPQNAASLEEKGT